jgi:hypothetical protein
LHPNHNWKVNVLTCWMLLQFAIGQAMVVLNRKNPWQKVASNKISGHWGVDKFHGSNILEFGFNVDVGVVHVVDIPLMRSHEANDQVLEGDVVGTCCLWNWKYVKVASWWTFWMTTMNFQCFIPCFITKHQTWICFLFWTCNGTLLLSI